MAVRPVVRSVLSKVVQGILYRNPGGLLPNQILPPSGFGWTPPVRIFNNAGVYSTDYDPTPFLIEGDPGVTTYYVDSDTGNDGNPGTSGSPKKTLTTITGGRVTKLLIKARGKFYVSDGGSIQMGHDNLCVEAWGGASCIITTEASPNFPYVWTDEGGGVWSAPSPYTLHNSHRPYSGTNIETLVPYTAAADVTACQATAGSWVRTTGPIKHWVHTSDGSSPATGHTIFGNNGSACSYNASTSAFVQRIAFHGISFHGGDAAFLVSGTNVTYTKRLDFVNCNFKRAGQFAAMASNGTTEIISYGCTAGPSSFDGFSYTTPTGAAGGGAVPNAIEINCTGRYCGNTSTGANQGSTTHFTGKLIRVNGQYYNNADDQIADVGADTRSWNLGCTLGPKGVGSSKSGAQAGNDGTDIRMWFDGCTFTGLDYGWGAASGATIYYKNQSAPSTNPSSTGTITTY